MTCPHCESTAIHRRKRRTALGYRRFSCAGCQRRFNERTGTAFNELQFPTDIVLLAVLWRLRYKLGLRDVAELLLQRGYDVSYETIRAWEFRFTPLISADLRARRRGPGGRSSYLDETYMKVSGRVPSALRARDPSGVRCVPPSACSQIRSKAVSRLAAGRTRGRAPSSDRASRGDVWILALDPTVGSEIQKTRPVAVINSPAFDTVGPAARRPPPRTTVATSDRQSGVPLPSRLRRERLDGPPRCDRGGCGVPLA